MMFKINSNVNVLGDKGRDILGVMLFAVEIKASAL